MKAVLKTAARLALHQMGGLAILRSLHRRKFGVLMFHSFSEADQANLEALCSHITRHFQPVSLSTIVASIEEGKELPDNTIAITVDDGYRNFLLYGHPIFRKHRIPTTLYAVAGFSDGQLWLWTDQIEYGLLHASKPSLRIDLNGRTQDLPLTTSQERADAGSYLHETLKLVPNEERLGFLAGFGPLCGVEMPTHPPSSRAAMNWDELRAVSSEGVEVGCHTYSHPILSRLSSPLDLQHEIGGARQLMEQRLGMPVRHFCYPNGRPIDVGEAAIRCVGEAGYSSAVTCTWGMNTPAVERQQIRRTPFDSAIDFRYGVELLAGLHM